MLVAFKRKILGQIYCPIEDDKVWGIRYNTEIYDMKVTAFIKFRRLLAVGKACSRNGGTLYAKESLAANNSQQEKGRKILEKMGRWSER